MPKVFGFLKSLGKRKMNSLGVPTTGPFISDKPLKKKAHRHRPTHVSRTRPNREARKLVEQIREQWFRHEALRLQTAKSKTIRNDHLKLILEEAQEKYQQSLATQRAISAANLQRELAEFGGRK